MRDPDFPYCISHRRELTEEEFALVRALLQKEAPSRLQELIELKIVARCGCGECPTILFGQTFEDEPLTGHFDKIADYWGQAENGTRVGVGLYERDGKIAELEAWSVDGGPIVCWPPIDELERVGREVV